MRITGTVIMAFLALAFANPAAAQSISGEVGVTTDYLDNNNLVYSDGPHMQGGVDAEFEKGWTFSAWGSHGTNSAGGELDIGISKTFDIEAVELTVGVQRFFLRDSHDITQFSASASSGPLTVEVAYYQWRLEDVVRITASYDVPVGDSLTVRPQITYETEGFGARSVTAGVGAEYNLGGNASLRGLTLYDGRNVRASFGLFIAFSR